MTQCIIIQQDVLSVTLRLVSILKEIGREAVITQMDGIFLLFFLRLENDLTCWGSRGVVCLTRRLDAVVVVVISMMDVDVSERLAVVLDCGVMEAGDSPTSRTLPWTRMLGSPSAAMLKTFRPL